MCTFVKIITMNWTFEGEFIKFSTEQGVTLRKYKETEEDLVHFTGGTLVYRDDSKYTGWFGGVEINYRRYFMRDGGKLIPKNYVETDMTPYSFKFDDEWCYVRLWEPIEYVVPRSSVVEIENLKYILNYKYLSVKLLTKYDEIFLK